MKLVMEQSGQSLSNYLNKFSLLNLHYLPTQTSWNCFLFQIFSLFFLVMALFKGFIFILEPFSPSTALLLGDYAINLGAPHHFLHSINLLWLLCGFICFNLIQSTNVSPKKQFWFHSLSILEGDVPDWTRGTKAVVIYLFFHNLKSNLILGGAFSWCLYIPVLIESNSTEQFFFLNLSGFNGAIAGYCCTAFCVNFSFIFAFYSVTTALKYDKIASRLRRQVSTLSDPTIIDSINHDLIQLLIENHKANYFWTQLNSTIFLLTFIAQIPILYLIFFVPLTNFTKFSMVILGALNFLCGQSITFLSGSFAKTKLDKCHKQLNRLLISRDDLTFYHRIQLICSADYLINRHLFYIFGQFEFTHINYLLVIMEIISHLLLLIANAGAG
ncbi:uncharacterized protein LOC112539580 [Tetranychus urticae]|uniref:Gustatory receptor n=1 Tax=Tetranychus urticae TaxID=32264 RepID=T1L0Z4_TETUR|nr:uncharacterized protein LOC112539580 [Tetranychus urticae]